jgi:hypothetical protein
MLVIAARFLPWSISGRAAPCSPPSPGILFHAVDHLPSELPREARGVDGSGSGDVLYSDYNWLAVSNMSYFSIQLGIIIPTDSYFSRWLKHVKTTNQL